MTPEAFAYWLHGFTELNGGVLPSHKAWKSICEHLDLVFKKVTPPVENDKPKAKVTEVAPVPTPWPNTTTLPFYPPGARGGVMPAFPGYNPSYPDIYLSADQTRHFAIDPSKTTLIC